MAIRFRQWSAALAILAVTPAWLSAQQAGTITGRVIDVESQGPVPNAQIVVVGTTWGAHTDVEGHYHVANVRAGTVRVRAQRIGYESRTQEVTITAGQSATADFALTKTAVQIDQVVITATGQTQRKRESGVATGRVAVDSLNLAPVTDASNLIQARVPGVTVLPSSGTVGANSGIHIRGANSVSLSNDPLLIVDGVRANGDLSSSTIGVGGQRPSRLNDINPEDIADIEIIKGPAAAALYGTAAANGVIYITTKRGHAGETRWSAHVAGGSSHEVTEFPANYSAIDLTSSPGDTIFGCANDFVARGLCHHDGLVSFNPLEQASPYRTGNLQNYGLSVAGGSDKATYYISGNFEKNQGVVDWNHVRHTNVRANVRGQLRDNVDVTANFGYTQSRLRLPQNDNNTLGILGGGLLGSAQDDSVGRGYILGQTPAELANIDTRQNVERFTGSLTGDWQTLSWLSFSATGGVDFTNRIDQEVVHPGKVFFADLPLGQRTSNPFQNFLYTARGGASGTFSLTPSLRSTTSLGVEYNEDITRGTFAFGETLLPGTGSLNGTNTLFAVGETNIENVTLGAYAQEQLALNDKLFLTAALRGDKNSAFGQDFKSILYPSTSLSWVIGEEPFFPAGSWVSSLRLRTAYGESGQRPNFRDAIRFLTPVSVTVDDQDAAGFTIGGVGNQNLKAERSKELELGFDAGLFDERVALSFTYYNKRTEDALISRALPPSNGQQQSRFENLGEVRNNGLELLLNAIVVNSDPVRWDVTLNGSTNHNEVTDLGEGIKPIIVNNGEQRHQNGYPLGGYWARPIVSSGDANGDGIISRDEVTLDDSAHFIGTPFPTRELSVGSGITLFKWFRVAGLLDYHGGQKLLNLTRRFRCVSFANCQAANDPDAPLDRQVDYIAGLEGSDVGFMEDASFWKLRELSLTVSAPQHFANRLRLSTARITFAGRNLATWTKYTGFDPELVETGGDGFRINDFLTQPPLRYYTVRLDFTW